MLLYNNIYNLTLFPCKCQGSCVRNPAAPEVNFFSTKSVRDYSYYID